MMLGSRSGGARTAASVPRPPRPRSRMHCGLPLAQELDPLHLVEIGEEIVAEGDRHDFAGDGFGERLRVQADLGVGADRRQTFAGKRLLAFLGQDEVEEELAGVRMRGTLGQRDQPGEGGVLVLEEGDAQGFRILGPVEGIGADDVEGEHVLAPDRGRLPIDFWVGRPDPSQFPGKFWRQAMLAHLRSPGGNLTEYGEPTGLLRLREAVADYLGPARGIKASADQVIIVSGIQQALNVVARLLVREGSPVVTECPCYQGAALLFESYGARLVPVDVDADGLEV